MPDATLTSQTNELPATGFPWTAADARGSRPQVILIGTGSEVHIALAAREELQRAGIAARVVSMACIEWFYEQDRAYRDEVLPPQVTARVSIEAGVGFGWRQIVGDLGEIISLEHFGAAGGLREALRRIRPDPGASS